MVFEGNRLFIINELLKETELIAVEDLKKRLKIINPKIDRRGIDRDHLTPLTEEGVIEYGSSPKPRTNKPPESVDAVRIAHTIEALQQLFNEYPDNEYPDHIKLYRSAYVKSMIAPPLLREIEKLWYITASYRSEKELEALLKNYLEQLKKRAEIGVEGIKKEEWPDIIKANEEATEDPYYTKPTYFTEEDVLEILRLSPTALKKALEGFDYKREKNGLFFDPLSSDSYVRFNQTPAESWRQIFFQRMLLASLILDSTMNDCPGYMFDPELSIKIYAPQKIGSPDKNKFFHKKVGLSIFHPKNEENDKK